MSVPVNARKEGKLHVLVLALDLTTYTIMICKNPKVFNPLYNTAITNDIVHTSKDIYIKLWRANNIVVSGDKEKLTERLKLQSEAAECCNELLPMIQIAAKLFHLSSKRVKYWAEKTIELRGYIRKWRDADRHRYGT